MTRIELCETRRAILDQAGHILVTGGPGCGKTTVAMLKAQRIMQSLKPGEEILFLSFSRAAVRQVLNKSAEILTREERSLIQVQTYHSFCIETLIAHGRQLHRRPCRFVFPGDERLRKSGFTGDWDEERTRLAIEEGTYCFDLLAMGTANLFEKSVAVRKLYGKKFPLVIVDEFQDTDEEQWRIVKALASVTGVFCLADPDQRIFEYRASVNPRRLDELRETLSPAEFDLGSENHRSPTAGILTFADCVLRNHSPLPKTNDVTQVKYRGRNDFDSMVHAAVIWAFGELRKRAVVDPTVAVMCRSNAFLATLAAILREEHTLNGKRLAPVEHSVVWDAELAAAGAAVVGSILEWSQGTSPALPKTLRLISRYYQMRNAEHPSKSAAGDATKYAEAANLITSGGQPRLKAVKELSAAWDAGMPMTGDPVKDWRAAQELLKGITAFSDIFRDVSMVRLFGARDALATGLSSQWVSLGHYGNASHLVKGILDQERFFSVDRVPRGCTLMTMHKSKGKEFDGVVLVEGAYQSGLFDTSHDQPPYEKSRRLIRVALTRARHLAIIVRPSKCLPLAG